MAAIDLYVGKKFSQRLTYKDSDDAAVDITGYIFTASIKKHTDGTALIELDSDGNGLTLGGAAGTIDIVITEAQTAAFTSTGMHTCGVSYKTAAGQDEQHLCEFGINIRTPIDEQS